MFSYYSVSEVISELTHVGAIYYGILYIYITKKIYEMITTNKKESHNLIIYKKHNYQKPSFLIGGISCLLNF